MANEKEATKLLAQLTGDVLFKTEELFGMVSEQTRIVRTAYIELYRLLDTMKSDSYSERG